MFAWITTIMVVMLWFLVSPSNKPVSLREVPPPSHKIRESAEPIAAHSNNAPDVNTPLPRLAQNRPELDAINLALYPSETR
jgi:hypothetical protein